MIKRTIPPLLKPFLPTVFHHLRPLTAAPATDSSPSQLVNPAQLLRVCTILYQQQNSSDSKLFSSLNSFPFHLTHEFFLQVCNKFPYSWKPVYKFFQYTQSHPGFRHTSTSFNKLADVASKSRNISLFWDILDLMAREKLANDKTFRIALKTLASARELKKCVEFFHLMNENGVGYNVETLNKVVETLCGSKLVEEAKHVVLKMKGFVEPNRITYECLVKGFCEAGDLIEACKLWNLMVDEGLEPDMSCVETIMETFFKINRYGEGLKLLENVRSKRIDDLGLSTYRLVIDWLCKKGRIGEANMIFEEMRNRGIEPDNLTLSSLVYGLVMRGRVREGYKIVEGVERPDISVYHGLIKGLLKLKRAGEATEVFREMIRRGCEPTMHTYVMLLQGHLGRRGRKGHDPLVNFDTIFVGGLVKAGKSLEATKYVERVINRGLEVPRFDYNKFLHYFSNEEGVVMFEETGKKLREVGLFDLADIFIRYGEKMATRDRRRDRERFCHEIPSQVEQNLELPSEVFDADIVNVKKLS